MRYLECQNKQAWEDGLLDESTVVYASSCLDYKSYTYKAQGLLLIKQKFKIFVCVNRDNRHSLIKQYRASLDTYTDVKKEMAKSIEKLVQAC